MPRAPLAPHVQAALARTALRQPTSQGIASPNMAPHMKAALAPLQARLAAPAAPLAAHVREALARTVQAKVAPVIVRRGAPVAQRMEVESSEGRPKRQPRMTQNALASAFDTLSSAWKKQIAAGTEDSSINLQSTGQKSCAARLQYRIGYAAPDWVEGKFDSWDKHAEMDALENYFRLGLSERYIEQIQIETEPCPRCAVVLNRLGLASKVFYKKSGGFKDYPTWRFPDVAGDWATLMGVATVAGKTEDQEVILNKFATTKWW